MYLFCYYNTLFLFNKCLEKNVYKISKINFRALQEAQEIFGVDFDYADFAQEDEYDEEMEEDVCII